MKKTYENPQIARYNDPTFWRELIDLAKADDRDDRVLYATDGSYGIRFFTGGFEVCSPLTASGVSAGTVGFYLGVGIDNIPRREALNRWLGYLEVGLTRALHTQARLERNKYDTP